MRLSQVKFFYSCRNGKKTLAWIIQWYEIYSIQKIDGKEAHNRRMHTKATISGDTRRKMVGRKSTEIRLDASDTKKSMISFRTRRGDSKMYWFYSAFLSFCRLFLCRLINYRTRNNSCSSIYGVEDVSYRSLNADCKIHSCDSESVRRMQLSEVMLQSVHYLVAIHGAGN